MTLATVVITTKNRRDDLARAVASALAQRPPVDVLVIDDGSTDGTGEMLRQQFPAVKVHRTEVSQGYIVARNLGAKLAVTPFVVSIDDDAELVSPDTIAQTLTEFDDARIAGVAIPYIDIRKSPRVIPTVPATASPTQWYVNSAYTGTSHALRRELFNQLGGYQEALFHQGEERDYALRLLDAGYVIRLGKADPIHHHESPKRDTTR
ncbi:MAG: glycosyltransferase, partial [Phycisphaeraceae bacterium]|nr:glycosyltransferase [Phycisphaeraceae bacterium]